MTAQDAKSFVSLAACGLLWLSTGENPGKSRENHVKPSWTVWPGYYFKT